MLHFFFFFLPLPLLPLVFLPLFLDSPPFHRIFKGAWVLSPAVFFKGPWVLTLAVSFQSTRVPLLAIFSKGPWVLSLAVFLFSFLSKTSLSLSSNLHSQCLQVSVLLHRSLLSARRNGKQFFFSRSCGAFKFPAPPLAPCEPQNRAGSKAGLAGRPSLPPSCPGGPICWPAFLCSCSSSLSFLPSSFPGICAGGVGVPSNIEKNGKTTY